VRSRATFYYPATVLASVDGTIRPAAEATIPVTDEGLLRGDGAFEVIRLYGSVPFALGEHLARLRTSCNGIRLDCDVARWQAEIEALLAEAQPGEALLRLVQTRGGRRIAIVEPLPPRPASARVMTVTYSPTRVLDGLKTLSYAANMLAGRLAKEEGFDEALFVTPHGRVLEGPTWTFFWVRDGILRTPPLTEHILASITRERILAAVEVREEVCTRDDLAAADEAFIASSVREVMPIAQIDERELPAVPGPVTQATAEAFRAQLP
jgi:branched-chain amino acid aminotransferase